MSQDNSRKTGDVLLSLENKIDTALKMIQTVDMNHKLILDRLNRLVSVTSIGNKPVLPSHPIPSITAPIISSPDTVKKSSSKKITVGQNVVDASGKPVFLAEVIISDLENSDIYRAKTSTAGKWSSHLPMGKFSLKISKVTDLNSMNKIELTQEIQILDSMKSLQLPVAILKK